MPSSGQSILPSIIDYTFSSAVGLQHLGPAIMQHIF